MFTNLAGTMKPIGFQGTIKHSGTMSRIRSDNGGEYLSKDFKDILSKNNIRHELTSPYSPHQNSCAERSWRTLFSMARTMIYDTKLPKCLWPYAVMHASYIRNRCYNNRLSDTPYGAVTGSKPDFTNLHAFGSICYSYIEGHKKKLDPRGRRGVFVGYDKYSPSYLVFYPENNTVRKHRVVKFTDKFEVENATASCDGNGFVACDDDVQDTGKSNNENGGDENEASDKRKGRRVNQGRPPKRLGIDDECDDQAKSFRESADVLYMIRIPTTILKNGRNQWTMKWTL